MSRNCPVCPKWALSVVRAGDVEIDVCPSCEGMWLDRGELELFPDRPATRELLSRARLAPSRCRKNAHRVARGLMRCAGCGSDVCTCPACGQVLSTVGTVACVVEVCTACEGLWLDKGEFEALEGLESLAPPPAKNEQGWVIPEATDHSGRDPWLAPGQSRALVSQYRTPTLRAPFGCNHCDAVVAVHEAWAFQGEIYCSTCRPDGAVSGSDLPKGGSLLREVDALETHWGGWRLRGLGGLILVTRLVRTLLFR